MDSFRYTLNSAIAESYGKTIIFSLWETSTLISIMTTLVCTPTNSGLLICCHFLMLAILAMVEWHLKVLLSLFKTIWNFKNILVTNQRSFASKLWHHDSSKYIPSKYINNKWILQWIVLFIFLWTYCFNFLILLPIINISSNINENFRNLYSNLYKEIHIHKPYVCVCMFL